MTSNETELQLVGISSFSSNDSFPLMKITTLSEYLGCSFKWLENFMKVFDMYHDQPCGYTRVLARLCSVACTIYLMQLMSYSLINNESNYFKPSSFSIFIAIQFLCRILTWYYFVYQKNNHQQWNHNIMIFNSKDHERVAASNTNLAELVTGESNNNMNIMKFVRKMYKFIYYTTMSGMVCYLLIPTVSWINTAITIATCVDTNTTSDDLSRYDPRDWNLFCDDVFENETADLFWDDLTDIPMLFIFLFPYFVFLIMVPISYISVIFLKYICQLKHFELMIQCFKCAHENNNNNNNDKNNDTCHVKYDSKQLSGIVEHYLKIYQNWESDWHNHTLQNGHMILRIVVGISVGITLSDLWYLIDDSSCGSCFLYFLHLVPSVVFIVVASVMTSQYYQCLHVVSSLNNYNQQICNNKVKIYRKLDKQEHGNQLAISQMLSKLTNVIEQNPIKVVVFGIEVSFVNLVRLIILFAASKVVSYVLFVF